MSEAAIYSIRNTLTNDCYIGHSISAGLRRQTPEQIEGRRQSIIAAYAKNPELCRGNSERAKRNYNPLVFTPDVISRRNESIRRSRTPELRQKISQAMRAYRKRQRDTELDR